MNYPALTPGSQQQFSLPWLNKGLCGTDGDGLSTCENLWFRGGALRTRPALNAAEQSFCYQPAYGERVLQPPRACGVRITQDGAEREIIAVLTTDYISCYRLCFFKADGAGGALSAGSLDFHRVSDDCFYIPRRYCVFTAEPTAGGGLYAFVTTEDYDGSREYLIYESTTDFDGWIELNESACYIPTLYINGRGASYSAAELNGTEYPNAPTFLEQQNLLTGRFYAYFSSDGYSSAFRLPLSALDDEAVICRIYSKPGAYFEWTVGTGQTQCTTMFAGRDITMTCDRAAGVIEFFEGSALFPIMLFPLFGGNNIRISAAKALPNGRARAVGSSFSAAFDSRIYIGGNGIHPNEIYCARRSNPLYFPLDCTVTAGESGSAVTAAALKGNRLVVFKSDAVYSISVTHGDSYTAKDFSPDGGIALYHSDIARVSAILPGAGCCDRATVCRHDGALIWHDGSDGVYLLPASGGVQRVSEPVRALLRQYGRPDGAAVYDGHYLLFFQNRVLAFSCASSGSGTPVWYSWKLPGEVYASDLVNGDTPQLLCCTRGGEAFYTAALGGGDDRFYSWENDAAVLKTQPIEGGFALAPFDCGEPQLRKRADALFLTAAGTGELTLSCGSGELRLRLGETDGYTVRRMNPHIRGERAVPLSVSFCGEAAIKEILLCYRTLGEIR